ncbi:MAG: hypothetical protein ACRDGQ_07170, partial [Candidatus Limnocylindrales bacterium]
SCIGAAARATLARFRFDVAVIGTAGLSAEVGITDMIDEEADIHRQAIEQAGRVMVLADGSKLGLVQFAAVGPASSIDVLITDPGADPDQLQRLRDLGVEVVLATATAASGTAEPLDGDKEHA